MVISVKRQQNNAATTAEDFIKVITRLNSLSDIERTIIQTMPVNMPVISSKLAADLLTTPTTIDKAINNLKTSGFIQPVELGRQDNQWSKFGGNPGVSLSADGKNAKAILSMNEIQ